VLVAPFERDPGLAKVRVLQALRGSSVTVARCLGVLAKLVKASRQGAALRSATEPLPLAAEGVVGRVIAER
jgi:hypothetical protein